MKAADLTVAGFASWAATYDETVARAVQEYCGMTYAEALGRVCEAAEVAPGSEVLDVGTGTGALALALARQLTTGRLVGIDPTPEMLSRASENASKAGLAGRIEFRRASAEALPFPDASFDVVVSSFTLHHTRVRQALPEIARVLKPGGRLAVADMLRNRKWDSGLGIIMVPAMALYYLITKRSYAIARSELAAYRQYFLKEDWEEMLRQVGFVPAVVAAFPHPTSAWYSGVVVIRASKGS